MAHTERHRPGVEGTVLVVDDTEPNREIVRRHLAPRYDVLEAENGFAALDLLDRAEVDVVLLDVMMPGLSGHDVCREIKARAGEAFLPVVLFTALSQQRDRNEGLQAGADDFLSKPVDRVELILRVGRLVRMRRQDQVIRRQLGEIREGQRVRDELVGLILHDLRNPLWAIDGYLSLLVRSLRDHADPVVRRRLEGAREACLRLQELTDGVLEVQGMEARGLEPNVAAVEVRALLEDAARTLRGAAEAAEVRVEIDVETDATVEADRRLLARAVENLLTNAIKYSPRGEAIRLRAAGDGPTLCIEVADRGPGIADEYKARIFERFRSADVRNGGRRGHGLGLHLVKLVAEAHRGSVVAEDRPGGGTVFRLSIDAGALAGAGRDQRSVVGL